MSQAGYTQDVTQRALTARPGRFKGVANKGRLLPFHLEELVPRFEEDSALEVVVPRPWPATRKRVSGAGKRQALSGTKVRSKNTLLGAPEASLSPFPRPCLG